MTTTITIAQALAQALHQAGVRRMFGLPGGGSSLDLMEATAQLGIEFILTKTENAAIMMAGALAETSGVPGVALTTKGPGVSNGANGVAYASLDRAPVLVITDGFTNKQMSYVTHQMFDQRGMLQPVVKGFGRLESDAPWDEIESLIRLACTVPFGPVHIELTGETARKTILIRPETSAVRENKISPSRQSIDDVLNLIRASIRPVLIVGLESRQHPIEVQALAQLLSCPVLPTYKGKGVVSDFKSQVIGVFTGGSQEEECIAQADLMLLVGLDPVEMILQPWRYNKPAVEIAASEHAVHYVEPRASTAGDLGETLLEMLAGLGNFKSQWQPSEIEQLRINLLGRMAYPTVTFGIAPDRVVQLAAQCYAQAGVLPRMSVDAGAHMFSATTFFPSTRPGDSLISNGLATMAFALPAAIATALEDNSQAVICFTGDGGLMMCLGELCTAVETNARVIVVVFNDSALSLIDIKQQSRTLPSQGVHWQHHDFAATMQALGGTGFSVSNEAQYQKALSEAIFAAGPCLIDVLVDPSGYSQQLKAMRG